MADLPALLLYPADWQGNAKLRRTTLAQRGAWMECMLLMHDQPQYGVLRWPLAEIAKSVGARFADMFALAELGIIKGDDGGLAEPYLYTPRNGRHRAREVVLLAAQHGPLWYSSRMVRDFYIRSIRGGTLAKYPDGFDIFGNEPCFGTCAPSCATSPPSTSATSPPSGGAIRGVGSSAQRGVGRRATTRVVTRAITPARPLSSFSYSIPPTSSPDGDKAGGARAHASPTDETDETPATAAVPTSVGLACRAMRAAGLASVNPSNPTLAKALAEGMTVAELEDAARVAVEREKGFAWALQRAIGMRQDAAKLSVAPAAPNARFLASVLDRAPTSESDDGQDVGSRN